MKLGSNTQLNGFYGYFSRKEEKLSQMVNRHIKTPLELIEFFEKPHSSRQKQYEAVRALVVEKLSDVD